MKNTVAQLSITAEIEAFIEEWLNTIKAAQEAIAKKDFSSIKDDVLFSGVQGGNNTVNRDGYRHLENAARILLAKEGLSQKISVKTAVDALAKAHFALVPVARKKLKFSPANIIDTARKSIQSAPRQSGIYVYPAVFAPAAKNTEWTLGPVRILSKPIFLERYKNAFDQETNATDNELRPLLVEDWETHSKSYDHFVLVNVPDHEWQLAKSIGREAAEFFLNIVRMFYTFYHTDDIRIGDGFIFESKRSSVYLDPEGNAHFSSASGPFGTHLEDGWPQTIEQNLGCLLSMFGSYLHWFINGQDTRSPIIERVRYASMLIAEAYSEPFDHIRLVRLISAFEALALIEGGEKASPLAMHCEYAGRIGDLEEAKKIGPAVKYAYKVRNAIVHGEMPEKLEMNDAFYGIEKYAFIIFSGFLAMFARIQKEDKPKSIKQLRRLLKHAAPTFFEARAAETPSA